MQDKQHVAVIDFGSQYTQLIVRRVRELGYFAKLYALEDFPEIGEPGAIILSGGPSSVYAEGAPGIDPTIFTSGTPVFGMCYGFQLMAAGLGGTVARTGERSSGGFLFIFPYRKMIKFQKKSSSGGLICIPR